MIASPNGRGWRWLQSRLGALVFAFAFLGSAVGSTVVRDAEETAEYESDTNDAIVSSKRSRARSGRHGRRQVPATTHRRPLARVTVDRGAQPPTPVVQTRRTTSHIGLPRRAPPDDADDDADATA